MTEINRGWSVLVLAGQRPGTDPLASAFGGTWKALVPIAGEPMITHVVRTLVASGAFRRIIVIAQDVNALRAAVETGGEAELAPSGNGISKSILSTLDAAEQNGEPLWPLLVTTADHPLLTPAMISEFLGQADSADLSVGMVERSVMRATYPDNKRTWLKFSDGHWSGANLFGLTAPPARAALSLWADAEQDRKTAWKLFLHFGPWLALRALTRTIGLNDALQKVGRRLGMSAQLVSLTQAEAAIDVDKPSDHVLASEIMAQRKKSG